MHSNLTSNVSQKEASHNIHISGGKNSRQAMTHQADLCHLERLGAGDLAVDGDAGRVGALALPGGLDWRCGRPRCPTTCTRTRKYHMCLLSRLRIFYG